MLYRLAPPASVTWSNIAVPRIVDIARENPEVDLDQLDWEPTEERAFSDDLLRLAVRYGLATTSGIVLEMKHAANLGHADTIRSNAISTEHARADLYETESMKALYRMFPGMADQDAELDDRVRRSTESAARRVEADLAEQLAAPPQADLVDHWRRLGGGYPD